MKKLKFLICMCMAFTFSLRTSFAEHEKFKAIFIYQFTKYIEWPKETNSNQFVIGVLNDSDMLKELLPLSNKKMVGNRMIQVKKINSIEEAKKLHIVFVSKSDKSKLDEYAVKLKGSSVLLITNSKSACKKGAGINFVSKSGNLNFEINKDSLLTKGLKINDRLLTLGTEVKND